jgi:class 3 adenylate cyclase
VWSAAPCSLSRRATGEARLGGEAVSRRLAAIVAADVAGYSRLMAADEEGTRTRLKSRRHGLIDPKIARQPIAAG